MENMNFLALLEPDDPGSDLSTPQPWKTMKQAKPVLATQRPLHEMCYALNDCYGRLHFLSCNTIYTPFNVPRLNPIVPEKRVRGMCLFDSVL